MRTLIIVPSVKRLSAPDWLFDMNRQYDVLYVDYEASGHYKDYFPKSHSDWVHPQFSTLNIQGQKWAIVKVLLNDHYDVLDTYDQIGFWDDDLEANCEDINYSLVMAEMVGAKMWQMALTQESDCYYSILRENPAASLYRTNFIEIMAPFYHVSLLPRLKMLLNMYDVSTGWGLDIVAPYLFDTKPVVIHSKAITHPKKENSAYDKDAAVAEQHECYKAYRKLAEQFILHPNPETLGQQVYNVF